MIVACTICGTEVKRKPSRPGQYCSHKCYWAAKKLGAGYLPSHLGARYGHYTAEHKLAMSQGWERRKGTPTALRGKKRQRAYPKGKDHPMWKGGITTSDRAERMRFRRTLQKDIFARDDYTCVQCDTRGGFIQVDHILSWATYPKLRFDEGNCRTLCMACHYKNTFGHEIPEGIMWGHNLKKAQV